VPKIISEPCELVKLCHINRSGPVFFETVYLCHLVHGHGSLVKNDREAIHDG